MRDDQQRPEDDEDSGLFAGDSPRWRETDVEPTSEAKRRSGDAPAPTSDTAGAIDREADPRDVTQPDG
jgi:hypothetical protein